jgi:curved DNA-binding protein CbpA
VSGLYDTLGVAPDASQDEVKTAFRRAAAAAHPDREGGDAERMAAINRAYETLGDPDKRAEYDATGETDSAAKLEDEARSRLVALFQAVLDASDDGDLMRSCRMLLGNARAEIANNHARISSQAARLRKQRNRIRRKQEGENLFTSLVDSKLKQADEQLAALERGRTVFARVAEMLEAYEADPATAPQPMPWMTFNPATAWGTTV